MMIKKIETALKHYTARTGATLQRPRAVMFDMDGILFDSMPGHCKAWKQVCDENGIEAEADEFYAYEGRTGASTIDTLIRRQFGRPATEAEIKDLYARKCVIFKSLGEPSVIPGAAKACEAAINGEALCILVTGSGQRSNLARLEREYPGVFPQEQRVTAFDVKRGKPDPEPYLIGMAKGGAEPCCTIGVDNAPLGVESSSRAGAFTIGVRTGPLPKGALLEAGADIEVDSMYDCAEIITTLTGR